MSIQFLGELRWVADFVGYEFPEGDEDAMDRIGGAWDNGSEEWSALNPELNWIRSNAMPAFQGQAAAAFAHRFKLLFDGNASVPKLATAMGAIGGLAKGTGTGIEKGKLQVLSAYAIAGFEISYAQAQTAATLGASEAEIPMIEESTIAAIRRVLTRRMNDILVELGKTLKQTTVSQIAKKSLVKTFEGEFQNMVIQAVQIANGHQKGINWGETEKIALADATGGAAQGAVGVLGKRVLKKFPMNPILQGGVVGYLSSMVKEAVASEAKHEPITLVSLLGSPIKSGITGAIRGVGGATVSTAPESVSEGGG
jgi:hypothetical protein